MLARFLRRYREFKEMQKGIAEDEMAYNELMCLRMETAVPRNAPHGLDDLADTRSQIEQARRDIQELAKKNPKAEIMYRARHNVPKGVTVWDFAVQKAISEHNNSRS